MDKLIRLKSLLDKQYEWPSSYTFKFIIPVHQVMEVSSLLDDHELKMKPSRTGKYVSVSATKVFYEADHVIDVYTRVGHIRGLIKSLNLKKFQIVFQKYDF